MKRYEKRLRLRREVCFLLGVIITILTMVLLHYGIENYKDYLKECDTRTGHVCNIFGQ